MDSIARKGGLKTALELLGDDGCKRHPGRWCRCDIDLLIRRAREEMIREFVAVAYDAGADGIHDRSAADATDRIVAAICALPTEAK